MLGEPIGDRSYRLVNNLKSGIVLCKLANKIIPGSVPKIHERPVAFAHMVCLDIWFFL